MIEISTLAQLNAMRWDLDGDGVADATDDGASYAEAFSDAATGMGCPSGGCAGYELNADLDFDTDGSGDVDSGDDYWNDGSGCVPVGSYDHRFTATFDGNGNSISNLYINGNRQHATGLFGATGSVSAVGRLALPSANVTGVFWVGPLVGLSGGTVAGSSASGSVSGADYIGGLVGRNDGTLTDSCAGASVAGRASVGGLTGINYGTLRAAYSTGAANGDVSVGGLVGTNGGTIRASYSSGFVSSAGGGGGLVGRNKGGETASSYWDTNTSRQTTSAGGMSQTTSQLQSLDGYEDIYSDWNVDVDNVDGDDDIQTGVDDPWYFGGAGQYPILRHGDYDADDDGLIEVGSLARLNAIRWDLDGDGSSGEEGYARAFAHPSAGMGCPDTGCAGYELTDDLDFDTDRDGSVDSGDDYWNNGAGWNPIAEYVYPDDSTKFNTTFDGNGRVITNLYINRSDRDNVGLFGITHSDSVIRNVGLASVNVTGNGEVGSLVGESFGPVRNSYAIGNVTGGDHVGGLIGSQGSGEITASFSLGSVSGSDYVGGLTGLLSPAASVSRSYASANVSGNDRVGGLTPYNNGTISDSYASGNVTGTSNVGGLVGYNSSASDSTGVITNSYAVGMVSGERNVGGLVGQDNLDLGDIEGSYWNVQTSGQSGSDGGDGKTIAELTTPTGANGIFAAWANGDSPWEFGTSREYPLLKVDLESDGSATWEEFGYQQGVSVTLSNDRPVVGSWQQIRAVLRVIVPSAGAAYQWQRTSAAGWRDVGPTSETKGVKFDSPGGRTYRALVTLSPGVVLASDPVTVTWRIGADVTVNKPSPARGEPVEWTARLGGRECSAIDYAWRQVDAEGTASYLEPGNSDTKTGMLFRAESLTLYVEITCSDDGDNTTYTSDRITVTATDDIWPFASITSDDDDNVAPVGTEVVLSTNLERRHPPLNWRVTWERRFGNGEWREVGKPLSARHHLKFDSPGVRTYRSSIYIIQLDETVKSDELTVTWTQ